MKEMLPLKFHTETIKDSKGRDHEQFICFLCQKILKHQKISALKGCGHVMCQGCISKYCSKKCVNCGEKNQGAISLQEGGSGYAAHSKVETSVY